MIRRLPLLAALTLLGACGSPPRPAVHHGLAADGYGFTGDSGHLPPPADLMTPVSAPPAAAAVPTAGHGP